MIKGKVRVDRRTKNLVRRLRPGEIPVIMHEDIDEVAAYSLLEKKVRVVINCAKSFTGKFPAVGAKILLAHDVIIIDNLGEDVFNRIREGDVVEIEDDKIFLNGNYLCIAKYLTKEEFESFYQKSFKRNGKSFGRFYRKYIGVCKKRKRIYLRTI